METVYGSYLGRPGFRFAVLYLLPVLALADFINVSLLQFCHLLNHNNNKCHLQLLENSINSLMQKFPQLNNK